MSLLPLEGFVVGVTADRRAGEQADLLSRRGAEILHAPTISTQYLGHDEAVRRATEAVIEARPDVLIATTGIGMRAWFEAAQTWGLADVLQTSLTATTVMARGAKAAAAVQVAGLNAPTTTDSERLDDLIDVVVAAGVNGRVVALQHYGRRDDNLVAALNHAGAEVVEVPIYRYRAPVDDVRVATLLHAICHRSVDAVTFTSAPAVHYLAAAADRAGKGEEMTAAFNSGAVVAACVGPVCAEGARAAGITHPVAPERGRLGLLVRAVTAALQDRRQRLRIGSTLLEVQGRAALVDGQRVRLTPSEAAALHELLRRPGAVASKAMIARALDAGSERAAEAAIARLRRRLGPAGPAIRAVRSRGYLIAWSETERSAPAGSAGR